MTSTQASQVKLVVFVPPAQADLVRQAMGQAGAGRIGRYTFCSYSSSGIGRFRPEEGAEPRIGTVGRLVAVPEERIEVVCDRNLLQDVIASIKAVHPYEEIVIDVYPLESISSDGIEERTSMRQR